MRGTRRRELHEENEREKTVLFGSETRGKKEILSTSDLIYESAIR